MKMFIQFIQNQSCFDLFKNIFQFMYKLIFLHSFPLILFFLKNNFNNQNANDISNIVSFH